ncbi:MAG: ComEC/Rec2 family competence protein [Longicatena sp.]
MKNTWLLIGMIWLFSKWIPYTTLLVVFLLCMTLFYLKHYKIHVVFFICIILVFLQCCGTSQHPKPVSKIVQIKEIKANYVIASTGDYKVVLYGVDQINFDDVIEVKGEYQYIQTIHNIQQFSFEKWLNRKSIYYQMNVKTYKVIQAGTGIRSMLYQRISMFQNKDVVEWIKSLLYGIHEDDVSFFVTSSGMHIAFLMYLLQKALQRKLSKRSASFIVFLGIGGMAYCTLLSSTLIRILCFSLVSYLFHNSSRYDTLGISMCFVLLLFPYMAYEVAFLLPVGFRLLSLFNIQKRNAMISSLCFMIPFQLHFFHSFNPIQILSFRIFRTIYAMLYLLAGGMVLFPMKGLLDISMHLYEFVRTLESWGWDVYFTPNIFWLLLWIYYFMKYLSYRKNDLKILCMLLAFIPCAPYIDSFGEIYMLDVGQGDCTLITLPFHQGTMLIDVMGSLYEDIPKDIIVPLLKEKGIHAIDKVIITHEDYDHSGGLKQLQDLIPVKEVIRTKQKETSLGNLRIPFIIENYEGKDANENSIVTYLEVFDISALFMGDVGIEGERELLKQYPNMEVDILKVGHHGSNTSSSIEFLHQIRPQIALISAGRNNRYHHPSTQTLERMRFENIYPLITSENGAVSIKFCKYFAFYRTADNEFGIINNR